MNDDSVFNQIQKALDLCKSYDITPTKIHMSEKTYDDLITDTRITFGRKISETGDFFTIFGLPIKIANDLPENTNWIIETEESRNA